MTKNTKTKRRRFTPEKRKSLILDHTADIVARDGLAAITMELIGKEAGISKSLVYTYFDSLTDLLRTLLKRELREQRSLQAQEAERAETFEGLVRGITHQYMKYVEDRGLIIERLQAEPSVAIGGDPMAYSRKEAVSYIAKIIADNFNMPADLANAAADISFDLPASAGAHYLRSDKSRKEIEDIAVTMIIGSLNALRTDYGMKHRKLESKPDTGKNN